MLIAARNAILAGGPTPAYWGLCFTAEQANSTVRISKSGSPTSPMTILYSTDAVNWSAYTIGTDIVLENVGDKVWMKAGEGGNSGSWFTSVMVFYRFKMTGLIAASGNLMSIVDGETETFTAKRFQSLFQGCTSLTTAPALPATTLVNSCYNSMFRGCTSLMTAPALPATTLVDSCYNSMFRDCTSLTTAPALPATTLVNSCYYQMFYGCTSLTTAPALPATTLVNKCYGSMFRNCTSLTTAPALPATTLASCCYYQMFYGCTALISVPAVLPAETLVADSGSDVGSGCYGEMFRGCTSLTTAPALPATTLVPHCYQRMFSGCTSLTATPLLPATSLPTRCYFEMFSGCTSLATIRTAQTQAWGDGTTDDPTYQWVNGVAASGTFYCPTALGTNATITRGVSACPEGWTVENVAWPGYWGLCLTAEQAGSTVAMEKHVSAPSVSLVYSTDLTTWTPFVVGTTVVTLANVGDKVWVKAGEGGNARFGDGIARNNHFVLTGRVAASGSVMSLLDGETESASLSNAKALNGVFFGCTALTAAPVLPATTLTDGCYDHMFYGCTALTTAPVLPATTLADSCYTRMFFGCTALTAAPALPATTLADRCYYQMFSGCTALTTAPALPAKTLPSSGYYQMFSGCTSLATIRTAQTQAWGDGTMHDPTYQWVNGVAASGTFYCPPALGTNATIMRGVSACPEGWTVENVA